MALLLALGLTVAPLAGSSRRAPPSRRSVRSERAKRQARREPQTPGAEGRRTTGLRLFTADRELNLTRGRLRSLHQRRRDLDQQLEVTRADLQRSVQTMGDQRARLNRRLRDMYKYGPARELEVILSRQSFAQLMTRWDYLLMVAEQDHQLLEEYRDRKDHVETLQQRLQGHLQQVDRTARQTDSENARLATLRSQQGSQVRTIQTQRQAYEAAAAEMEKTAKGLQSLLARLEVRRKQEATSGREVTPYTGDFAKGEGSLDWPVRGDVIGHFGPETHPRFGTVIKNDGIDISGAIGTPIHSVAKVKVEYVSDDYASYGQIVIIDHGDGYRTLYAHLSEIDVTAGLEVTAGQIIGRLGDSGSLKGPILHFEVRKGATALDPQGWLR